MQRMEKDPARCMPQKRVQEVCRPKSLASQDLAEPTTAIAAEQKMHPVLGGAVTCGISDSHESTIVV